MNKEYLINFLRENLTIIKSYGVTSLALFGSFARDEAKTSSDLDLLVEFQGKVTFDQYMDLKFFLEDNLGLSVDLVTKKMLKSQIINSVEKDAIYV
ncbi:nucleotidyltransferase family protein [Anabaena sp. AL09]|uniref:nucleotidyltransferase family protein n=1 Tax=Anabaena sp. AL09 TaxID=1710891 RepID=UPI0007FE53CE|nr:nucleotidyltransferase family protein [Anabaena sp. AL09]OBQ10586.1 MAG: DNA polymerase subunit beta [Anabaena sp. AL09]